MPCTESEEEFNAPRSPTMITPTKTSRNSGAGHGEPDAETETEKDESEQDECNTSDGKPRRISSGWLEYEVQEIWDTGPESTLERAEIDNQILQRMTKFMTDSLLFKTPGHKPKSTDIHLWKLYSKEYYSKRSEETIRIYKCPMAHRCKCTARCRVCIGKNSIRLEFHGTHDETSHATIKCERKKHKILDHKQIITIHEAVIIASNQSALKLRRNLLNARPEKHIDPELLKNMQRRVQKARKDLIFV